jgi:hypothetical protein
MMKIPPIPASLRKVPEIADPAFAEREAPAHTTGLPCERCTGTGCEPSAIERWGAIDYLLKALMWPPERVATLRDQIRADEYLVAVRHGGVDLKNTAGNRRTLGRYDS